MDHPPKWDKDDIDLNKFNMSFQQKLWERVNNKNSKVENAIAVAGLKAALLIGNFMLLTE